MLFLDTGIRSLPFLCYVILLTLFLLDFLTPHGFSHGMLYTIPILLSGLCLRRLMVKQIYLLATCATVIGALYSPMGFSIEWAILNRTVAIFVQMMVAILILTALRQDASLKRQLELSRATNRRLRQREAQLTNAQRVANIGSFEFDSQNGQADWSDNIGTMLGFRQNDIGATFDDFLKHVHPEDRANLTERMNGLQASDEVLDFVFRVARSDGETRVFREVAQKTGTGAGEVVSGIFLDITDDLAERSELEAAEALNRYAGFLGRLGGWRYFKSEDHMFWTSEIYQIYGLHPSRKVDVATAIAFYAKEERRRIGARFEACLERGENFDEVFRFTNASGREVWARVIGEPIVTDGNIVGVQGAFQDISELVNARREAQRSENRLTSTLEKITSGFMLLDRDLNFLFVNSSAAKMFGTSVRDLAGKNFVQQFPRTEGSPFLAVYRRVLTTGQSESITAWSESFSCWFEARAYPVPDGLAVNFTDVTEERKREEELILLRASVERLNDIVLITEATPTDAPDGPRIVFVNPAFERITGYTAAEAIGMTPRMLQGEKTQRFELDRIRDAVVGQKPVRAELINYSKTGREYWIEIDVVPISVNDREVTHLVAVERDVTERVLADRELRQSEERFQLVARATSDIIWDWDMASDRRWYNRNAEALFGSGSDEYARNFHEWSRHVHPEDRGKTIASMRQALKSDSSTWSAEYRLLFANGEYAHVADRALILRNPDGQAYRMTGSIQDVTALTELSNRLRHAENLEIVGRLSGGIAHDFNNLLTIIIGRSEMLEDDPDLPAHVRESVRTILSAADRGAELTYRLLAFARRQPLDPRATNVEDLIGELQPLLVRAVNDEVQIDVDVEPGTATVLIDPGQLEAALINLLINARDAMPAGGHVRIRTRNVSFDPETLDADMQLEPGDFVEISVADTGTGMTKDVQAKAFEPFFTTKPVGKGSGLGLSMVYGFAKQSRGHARIVSTPGSGTTVSLYLPSTRVAPERRETPVRVADLNGQGEHVLVVEDNSELRNSVCETLSKFGYKLTCVASGVEAISVLKSGSDIDILFTDIVMPGGMNGYHLADIARSMRADMPVLFTSGYAEGQDYDAEAEARGGHYISKPYRKVELARLLRQILDKAGQPVS